MHRHKIKRRLSEGMLPVRPREDYRTVCAIRWQGFKVPLVSWADLPQAYYFIGLIKVSVTGNSAGKKKREGENISNAGHRVQKKMSEFSIGRPTDFPPNVSAVRRRVNTSDR